MAKLTTDPRDEFRRTRDVHAANVEAAKHVMRNSKPTPTQEENDMAKLGLLHPDDKEDPGNPEMPSVYEQQRALEADTSGGYKTRAAEPPKAGAAKP